MKDEVVVINPVIFIPGSVPSLKNSKVKTSRGIFPSKTVTKYVKGLGIQSYSASRKEVVEYKTRPNLFKVYAEQIAQAMNGRSFPVIMEFHFVRKTKAKFDFNNANQILADLLVAHNVLEDDNMDYFIPVPFKRNELWYTVDKDNPGVYIKFRDDL